MGLPKKLTEQQMRFAYELVTNEGRKTATECAVLAGYDEESAYVRASELQNPKKYPLVVEYIGKRRSELLKKYDISFDRYMVELGKLRDEFVFPNIKLFFSDTKNFRKKIAPSYKGHRNRKKPCGYKRVINKLKTEFDVIIMPELEADDAMGIYATQYPGNIIVSPDKDMKQIPGTLYNR